MFDFTKPLRMEDIPVTNFGRYMIDTMRCFADEEALVDGASGTTYTYNDVIARTERLAAGLQRLGVQKGDVICIIAPNHLEYPVLIYSTTLVSAILQTVNPLFTKDDIHKMLEACNTKYIFTTPSLVPKVKESIEGLEHIQVIVFGEAEGCISFDSVLAPQGSTYSIPDADWKSTTAVLLSSSGTTGFPKAVELTHFALIANGIQMNRAGLTERGESLIVFLPMFHIYGLSAICATANCVGSRLILMSRFSADEYLRLIETYRATTLHVVPPVMVMFAKHPKVAEYDLSSVKTIICGAAPLSSEIEEAVKRKLGLSYIQQGYGLTETGLTHVNTKKDFRCKSVGKPVELLETKIVDVESGKDLGPNKEGEVWVRGPGLCSGYLNQPVRTRELIEEDGWLRTGDIGKQDKDGFLFIVDRLKELIKYKANAVAPASLEDILLQHDSVADVGVIGVPDEEAGELPRAYVVKKAGMEVTGAELQDFVAGQVAPYMKLRGGIEFVSEIPRSLSGKILRKTLRERARTST